MVTINLTLLILLLMFLGFLWIMHRFVFTPVLGVSDGRDEKIAEDKNVAREASADAEKLEDEYKEKLAQIHRETNLTIARTRRAAQEDYQVQVETFKKKAEEELRDLRRSVRSDIESQKDQFGVLAQGIAAAMARQLELE